MKQNSPNDQLAIKAVVFDCFGVLTGDKWKEFVASLPGEQQADASDLNRALDRGVISQAEFYEQINKLTSRSVAEVDSVINSEMHKNNILLEYIKQLKGKYKLAVLSNVSNDWIRQEFLEPSEIQLFDDFILSYEVGLIKPNPEIFRLTASRLGVELAEMLFIDDSAGNVQAANDLGVKAIVYSDFPSFKEQIDKFIS